MINWEIKKIFKSKSGIITLILFFILNLIYFDFLFYPIPIRFHIDNPYLYTIVKGYTILIDKSSKLRGMYQ